MRFTLATPFPYNPQLGSLGVDLFVYGQADRRLYTDATIGQHALARIGPIGVVSSEISRGALVLELQFQPVPEPRTALLALLGAFGLLARRRLK